jgi:hypothetical protein
MAEKTSINTVILFPDQMLLFIEIQAFSELPALLRLASVAPQPPPDSEHNL